MAFEGAPLGAEGIHLNSTSAGSNPDHRQSWNAAFLTVLVEAIADLETLIFEEGWDALVAEAGGPEAALRESVRHYERGLAHLFGFVRSAGALDSPVAWSTLKADLRRGALDAGQEITLRTALDSALYAAEQIPLGDHRVYGAYVDILTTLVSERAADGTSINMSNTLSDRLEQAYARLADLEDHASFHAAVVACAGGADLGHEVIQLETRLLALQRFDLILSTGLLWLAETGGCSPDA